MPTGVLLAPLLAMLDMNITGDEHRAEPALLLKLPGRAKASGGETPE
ncbi:hypothetical protein [Streptomyces boncukensis]